MNYGSLLTNVYTWKKLGHITQHQSHLYHTNDVGNDVILTNHKVCTKMTLHNADEYIFWAKKPRKPYFHPTANSYKPALAVGGSLKLRKFDIVRTDHIRKFKKTAASIFIVKTNEITRKHLISCSSIVISGRKPLKPLRR